MAGHTPWSEIRDRVPADPARLARRETFRREARTIVAILKLADLRKRRKLTQKGIAAQLGISQGRVSKIENGDDLQLTTLERYVEALGGRLKVEAVFPDATIDLSGAPSEDREEMKVTQETPTSERVRELMAQTRAREATTDTVAIVLGDGRVVQVPLEQIRSAVWDMSGLPSAGATSGDPGEASARR
jgi:transcriptional regulator with XRE-family HTH domain